MIRDVLDARNIGKLSLEARSVPCFGLSNWKNVIVIAGAGLCGLFERKGYPRFVCSTVYVLS